MLSFISISPTNNTPLVIYCLLGAKKRTTTKKNFWLQNIDNKSLIYEKHLLLTGEELGKDP